MLRRHFLAASGAAVLPLPAAGGPLIDTHIHLFEPDIFPYHALAPYRPPAQPLGEYLAFVKQAGIAHTILVHPEPYQDDHRYLEHCFAAESPRGFFKGTCLFEPQDERTGKRMGELVKRHPGRIVAMRMHVMNEPGKPFTCTCEGDTPIKNRDLNDASVKATWKAAADLGLCMQMHFLPHHGAAIGKLAAQFRGMPVILDHMGRAGMGAPAAFEEILKLARLPKVYFKFSGVGYSSKQKPPYADAAKYVRRAFEAFGAERILWGGLGHDMDGFRQAQAIFDHHFAFATEAQREMIRGGNAAKLFGFA
ncbi:MAG: amidohydrolase family protein [Bryobacterales bacterium]|nr:amidohydrolase family protein [Bryobacterales bacterium]